MYLRNVYGLNPFFPASLTSGSWKTKLIFLSLVQSPVFTPGKKFKDAVKECKGIVADEKPAAAPKAAKTAKK